jgi:hypothetical protein
MASFISKAGWIDQIRKAEGIVSNETISIAARYAIRSIAIWNTTANAVTGGIRIGTTNGGTEVVVATAVGANQVKVIPSAEVLLHWFSDSVNTTLYIQAVTAWNSANLTMAFDLVKYGVDI